MRRWLPVWVVLSGCAPVTAIGDKIIGLTNPVLVGGLVVGTELPDDPVLAAALEAEGIGEATRVELAVADALELRDMENALIDDAILTLEGTDVPVSESDWYVLEQGPAFAPGETWELSAELPDRVNPGTVSLPLPLPAQLGVDPVHDLATDLVVELGAPYDYAFAAVYGADGVERWTNAPTDADAIVDLVLPLSDPTEQLVVPAEAFTDGDLFVLGVAGLQRAPFENVDGLNEALTAVLAGQLELFPVVGDTPVGLGGLVLLTEAAPPPFDAVVEPTGRADVFVFDLLDAGNGIPDATATIDGVAMEPAELAGLYRSASLDLVAGQTAEILVDTDRSEVPARFAPRLAVPADLEVPTTAPSDTDLTLPLPAGTEWADSLVLLLRADGTALYSTLPDEEQEVRNLLGTPIGGVTSVTIPGEFLGATGPHLLGIAPLEDRIDALSGVNGAVSHGLVGTMTWHPLELVP